LSGKINVECLWRNIKSNHARNRPNRSYLAISGSMDEEIKTMKTTFLTYSHII
jgi:hypothetical protein